MAISFKGAHFPKEVILMGVRWYVAYPLSTRHVEELMEERGVDVDHSTINRWTIKYSPLLEEAFHRRKRPVWVSWRMDETFYEAALVKPFLYVLLILAFIVSTSGLLPITTCVWGRTRSALPLPALWSLASR